MNNLSSLLLLFLKKKLTEKAIFILPNPCLFLELDCSSSGVTHPTIAQGQPSIQTGSLSSKTEVKATWTNSVSKPDLPEDPNTQPQAPSCDRLFALTWIKSKVIVTVGHNKRARCRKKIQWSLLARRDSSSWYPKKPPWSLKPSATCSPLQVSLRLYNSLIINLHFLQYLGNLFFFSSVSEIALASNLAYNLTS